MSERIEYIDIFRGGAILLVLIQHCGILSSHVLAFHMPLFFFISGLLYGKKESLGSFKEFVKKRFDRLIVPYFCFEIIALLAAYLLHYGFPAFGLGEVYKIDFLYALRDIFLCLDSPEYIGVTNRLWFFPALFFSDIIFFWLKHFTKRITANSSFVCGIFFFLFILLSYLLTVMVSGSDSALVFSTILNPQRLPFTFDIALFGTAYIALGAFSCRFVDLLEHSGWKIKNTVMLTCFVVLILAVEYNSGLLLMFINSYGDYIITTIGAISGVFLFVSTIFLFLPRLHTKPLIVLGQNSLVFFPVHLYVLSLYKKVMTSLNIVVDNYYVATSLKFTVTLLITLSIIWFVNRYIRLLTGSVPILTRVNPK